jgi:hypothetical protein
VGSHTGAVVRVAHDVIQDSPYSEPMPVVYDDTLPADQVRVVFVLVASGPAALRQAGFTRQGDGPLPLVAPAGFDNAVAIATSTTNNRASMRCLSLEGL